MEDYTGKISDRVAIMGEKVMKHLDNYKKPTKLTHSTYKRVTNGKGDEVEFQQLVDEYGENDVYLWVKGEQGRSK